MKPNLMDIMLEETCSQEMYHCVFQPGIPLPYRCEGNWDRTVQQDPRCKPQRMGGGMWISFSMLSHYVNKSMLWHIPCIWKQ